MRTMKIWPLALGALLLSGAVQAQSAGANSEHQHHQHDAPAGAEQLGQVSFPVSCAAKSQQAMERGVALLHSFGYTRAQMQFESLARQDPRCAMAHWGIAMTQYQELWGRPEKDSLARGAAEMARARRLAAPPAHVTPREQAYIDALSAFYEQASTSFQKGADAYEAGMNSLHQRFPDDVEGAAFDALSILAAEAPTDTSLTHEHQALAILQPLFAAHPNHPGLAHYIIHTCDTPALAPEGLSAAREYAKIAPSSAHALHMPAHIFARLGMWPEDIESNLASVQASQHAEASHEPGAAHQMHADEFLIYAWLQVGEDAKAQEMTQSMRALGERMSAMPGMDDMKDAGHSFDNELRAIYNIEMHQWQTLATLTTAPGTKPYEGFSVYWGQAIAAAHLHDPSLAAAALQGFDQAVEAMKHSPYADYIDNTNVKRNEILAWNAWLAGHADEAVADMRKAAEQQDRLGQGEVDIPARELLGDLLRMEHKPEAALQEYRTALKLSPNRLNALLDAGAAAEEARQPEQAREYYRQAATQTGFAAHSQRPELAHAVQLAQQAASISAPTPVRPQAVSGST